jgi:hypothetical protein
MKTAIRTALGASLAVLALAATAAAQIVPPAASEVNLAGPRFGVTVLSDGVVQKLPRDDKIEIAGEHRSRAVEGGPARQLPDGLCAAPVTRPCGT